jgi:hypothetical protein
MDYTDVIMNGAGFFDDAKLKAQELASKAKRANTKNESKNIRIK